MTPATVASGGPAAVVAAKLFHAKHLNPPFGSEMYRKIYLYKTYLKIYLDDYFLITNQLDTEIVCTVMGCGATLSALHLRPERPSLGRGERDEKTDHDPSEPVLRLVSADC
jgi:hypothetical protein